MYVSPNFSSKAALKRALEAGDEITVFQPNGGLFGSSTPQTDGVASVEGPHYPKPHRWYGQVTLQNGLVIKVK